MRRRTGRPGLMGTMARTAVVAGTATAVSAAYRGGARSVPPISSRRPRIRTSRPPPSGRRWSTRRRRRPLPRRRPSSRRSGPGATCRGAGRPDGQDQRTWRDEIPGAADRRRVRRREGAHPGHVGGLAQAGPVGHHSGALRPSLDQPRRSVPVGAMGGMTFAGPAVAGYRARWRREDRAGSDAPPDNMRLAPNPFRAVAKGCAPVVIPCHLGHARMRGHAFHAQPWPERAVSSSQVWHESVHDDFAERRLLPCCEVLPVPFETGQRFERRHQPSAGPSVSR